MNGCNEKSRRNRDGGMRRESRKLVSGGPAKERKCVFVCVREGGGGWWCQRNNGPARVQ